MDGPLLYNQNVENDMKMYLHDYFQMYHAFLMHDLKFQSWFGAHVQIFHIKNLQF